MGIAASEVIVKDTKKKDEPLVAECGTLEEMLSTGFDKNGEENPFRQEAQETEEVTEETSDENEQQG